MDGGLQDFCTNTFRTNFDTEKYDCDVSDDNKCYQACYEKDSVLNIGVSYHLAKFTAHACCLLLVCMCMFLEPYTPS